MKKKTLTVCLTLFAAFSCCIFKIGISGKLGSLDIASLASAASIYYDIKVKLVWDKLYNLDLYVTEPDGEIASVYNVITLNGGEIGYYDEDGDWHAGGSGDNTAPEIYRVENAQEGTYEVRAYCPGTCTTEVITEAFICITLYEESSLTENINYPSEGTQKINLSEESWWNAGSFSFSLPDTGSGCFIATAVYGSSFAPEVLFLSDFRDKCLLKNSVGKWIVNFYYKLSPPCADFITDKPFLKKVIRVYLSPLVFAARVFTKNEE